MQSGDHFSLLIWTCLPVEKRVAGQLGVTPLQVG